MTKTCLLDYDSIAGADKFGNIFVLRVPADVSDDVDNPTGVRFAILAVASCSFAKLRPTFALSRLRGKGKPRNMASPVFASFFFCCKLFPEGAPRLAYFKSTHHQEKWCASTSGWIECSNAWKMCGKQKKGLVFMLLLVGMESGTMC